MADEQPPRILVVDDDPQLARLLRVALEDHGYMVAVAPDGQAAIDKIVRWRPNVVLLDLALPGLDGLEICRRVRGWSQVPILIISGQTAEATKVATLDAGADDYLVKPFGHDELLARIRVALRHRANAREDGEPTLVFGNLRIDRVRRVVSAQRGEVHLTPTEYELLRVLATHAGKVLAHRTILRAVWGPSYEQDVPTLRVFITQLRRKIEPDPGQPSYILTEPGVGYRFQG